MHEVRPTEIFYMKHQLQALKESLASWTHTPSERNQVEAKIEPLIQLLEAYRPTLESVPPEMD